MSNTPANGNGSPITTTRSETIAGRRCSFHYDGKQCDQEGTHRVVLLLSDAAGSLVKKIVLAVNGITLSRCLAHQAPHASNYFNTEMWNRLAISYSRSALEHGQSLVCARGLTRVAFEPEDTDVGSIPVLAPRPGDGKLEPVGKARLIK